MDVVLDGEAPLSADDSLSFPLLKLIVEARNEHGMRQQDWARYRKYCTTKTQRIRSTLQLTHIDAASHKQTKPKRSHKRTKRLTPEQQSAAAKGQGHTFVRRTIALEQVTDTRPMELLLFEAEHCWSAAEELWAQQTEETRAVLRRRSLGRARRAVHYAEQLVALSNALPALDTPSRAQCLAYQGLVRSAQQFIQGRWEATLRVAAVTRQLLTCLAECSSSSREEALASSFLDGLDAQIRFAAYSLGDTDDTDTTVQRIATPSACEETLPGFEAVTTALRTTHTSAPTAPLELPWRQTTIPVPTVELHDVVTRVRAEEQGLQRSVQASASSSAARASSSSKTRARLTHAERNAKRRGNSHAGAQRLHDGRANHSEMDPFDRALSALTDAESVARTLVEENAEALAKTHSARYEAAGLTLRRAHEWLTYRLMCVRVARNVRLLADVQARAEKREARALSLADERSCRTARRPTTTTTTSTPSPKKPQPGSRAKRPRSTPKRFVRPPGRSGTRRVAKQRRTAQTQRADEAVRAQQERRRLRLVPGLAKLLDTMDSSLLAMGGLEMVEAEPDVSNLLEAKRFYYCAVLLEHLAHAFAQYHLPAEALVLLQRADLYIRQASQSLELAEGADDEDAQFVPYLLGDDKAILSTQTQRIQQLRLHVLKDMDVTPASSQAPTSIQSTKSGQTLYYHALHHVSFDPVDVEHAVTQARTMVPTSTDSTWVDEDDEEAMDDAEEDARLDVDAQPMKEDTPAMPIASAPPTDGPFDPMNALEEEEERENEAKKSRGWLRGWFK